MRLVCHEVVVGTRRDAPDLAPAEREEILDISGCIAVVRKLLRSVIPESCEFRFQSQILKEIEERIARIDKAIDAESEGIKCLQELKARIISDVVTGKIDIRDVDVPEYEAMTEDIEDNTEGIDREEETEEE